MTNLIGYHFPDLTGGIEMGEDDSGSEETDSDAEDTGDGTIKKRRKKSKFTENQLLINMIDNQF